MDLMARISLFSFILFVVFSISNFYFTVYFQHKGLNNSEIGLVMGLSSAISIFVQPVWGVVSDRYRTVKKVLLFLLAASLLMSVPLFMANGLTQILIMMSLFTFFYAATGPMAESLMIKHAYEHNRNFGSIRLWGEVGCGVGAVVFGMLTDMIGVAYLGWMFLACTAASLVSLAALSDAKAVSVPVTKESLVRLGSNRKFLLFLGLVLLIAIPHRMNDVFLPIYIQTLGGAQSDTGVSLLVATLCGVPTMALAGHLFKRYNEISLMSVAAACYAARWLIISVADSPELVFAGQVLQIFTYPIVLMAAVQLIHIHVPLELKATGQTIFTAVFAGIGGIVGSTAGGWILDVFPHQTGYAIGAALALAASVLILLCKPCLVSKRKAAAKPVQTGVS